MDTLLTIALEAAIPLWQMKLKKLPWSEVLSRVKGVADLIGSKGDILQFGGGKKGEVAKVFNRAAEGIAVMSFLPGGVTIFGQHWEDQHPEQGR
jgi:hypothetical protein